MSVATDKAILAKLKVPADIAKTIGHVIDAQDFEFGQSNVDKAMLWLLRELGTGAKS
jgi:hypothetical protein